MIEIRNNYKVIGARLRFASDRRPRIIFRIHFVDANKTIEKSYSLQNGDKAHGRRLLDHIRMQIDQGTFSIDQYFNKVEHTETTLREFFKRYTKYRQDELHAGRISTNTIKNDHSAVKFIYKHLPPSMRLGATTRQHIDAIMNDKSGIADVTLTSYIKSFSTALSKAVTWGLINQNILQNYKHKRFIKQFYSIDQNVRYFSDEQVQVIRDHLSRLQQSWLLDMFNLGIWTGMRCGGIINLKSDMLQKRNNHNYLKIIEKGNKKRWIPLSQNALNLICRRIAILENAQYDAMINCRIKNERRQIAIDRAHSGFCFFEISSVNAVDQQFKRTIQNIRKVHKGFENKYTFHCTRHTFAVNYLARGGQLHHLQNILGHSSIEITRRIYAKDTLDAISQNIDNFTAI